jgi:hypothetical protein
MCTGVQDNGRATPSRSSRQQGAAKALEEIAHVTGRHVVSLVGAVIAYPLGATSRRPV